MYDSQFSSITERLDQIIRTQDNLEREIKKISSKLKSKSKPKLKSRPKCFNPIVKRPRYI